jgi:hypothetical protein
MRAAPDAPGNSALRALALAGFAVLALPVFDLGTAQLRNGDIFWQVRTGEIALRTGAFPDTDIFSYTVAGTPWNNHEWGFELAATLLYRAFGWAALRAMVLILCGGVLAMVAATLWRRAGPAIALFVTALAFLLVTYKFIPAPQTVSMAAFLFAFRLLRVESRYRLPALAALLLVWGNLTAEVVIFLPFLLLDEGLRLWEMRGEIRSLHRAGMLVLACCMPFVNPPWSSTLEYAIAGTRSNRGVNLEFRSVLEPAATVAPPLKWLAIALAVLYVACAIRALIREPSARRLRQLGPGLIAIAGAALMERNLWLLVLPAARLAVEFGGRPGLRLAAAAISPLLVAGWLTSQGWTPAAEKRLLSASFWSNHIDRSIVPVDCADRVADLGPGRRVYALRVWASYLIWRLPEDRVFIDGRNREYPDSVFAAAGRVWTGAPDALRILDETGTDVVVAWPAWNETAGLRGGPWKRTFLGPACAVFEKRL